MSIEDIFIHPYLSKFMIPEIDIDFLVHIQLQSELMSKQDTVHHREINHE